MILNENQWTILKSLLDSSEPLNTNQIVSASGLDMPQVSATVQMAADEGWATIDENQRDELVPAEGAKELLAAGLPERQALALLKETGRLPMKDLASKTKELNIPMNEIIKWGSARQWFDKDKGYLVLTDAGRAATDELADDEKAVAAAIEKGSLYLDELDLDADYIKKLLAHRNPVGKIKERTIRLVTLTDSGRAALSSDDLQIVKERNVLTSDDITSGEWKNIQLRHYDVTLEAEKVAPAKIHLMQKIIQETRTAFLEMGFEEIVSPMVESAFWDFDALFQPQDHPARDMQDTFYLTRPGEAKLPDAQIVDNVKRAHQDGGDTGSTGWGYTWSEERARQTVLRTHTTASTIRALKENPKAPRKVFCVGKVFRNESISYKHLPEFHQVDGIIIDENGNLATLLGTLKEFYRKMGFDKVRFKPDFFPYTEPSAEISVFMESKGSWIEFGGSGIFRPEVTRPLGCDVPVLAWGLGLERLAMLRYGLKDIRELYWSDIDKIKEVPLCQ
jgi:phenylalanyl-tRNA synthetase alpha chain